jgi:hypothetical protein
MLNWSFPGFVSGDNSFNLDKFLRLPHNLANAQYKKLAARHVLLTNSQYRDKYSCLNACTAKHNQANFLCQP